MKVLHVLNTSTFSGAENVACQIIKLFDDTDFFMAYCSKDGDIRDKLIEKNICFYPISEMSSKEIDRVIKEYKPDIIHAHDMRATYFSCRNSFKIPVISHIHNNAFDSRKLSIKSLAYLLVTRKIKHIFWVSEEALSQFVFYELVKNKSSVLYNVIDWNEINSKLSLDKNHYSFDVIYLGRLAEEKDPIRFISIIEKLSRKYPMLRVAIVGDGGMKITVEKLINDKGLTSVIKLLGYMNNPIKVLKDSKCLVMTSLREGLPMSVVEAQMVGTPVVSTPVGALTQIIRNDYNGFICNSDDDFINSIISIINNNSNYERLSNNSLEFAKKYNDKKIFMNNLIEQYK